MIQFLVYSNLFIALAAALLTLGTFQIFNVPANYTAIILLVFGATLFDYNLHRIIKLKFEIGVKVKNNRAKNNYSTLIILIIISFLGSVVSLFFIPIEILAYVFIVGFITILYSIPFEHLNLGKIDIRKLPFMKNIMIAVAWTIITLIIPYMYSCESFSTAFIIALIQRFIFILALTIPFDIIDIKEDKQQNLRTIPVILGQNYSWILANILICAFIILSFIHLPHMYSIVSVAVGAITIFIFNNRKLRSSIFYNSFWVDGTILLYGILLSITA